MSGKVMRLRALFVEDDKQSLEQFKKTLPPSIGEYQIDWDFCGSFSEALERLRDRRYDVVATDIYLDPQDGNKYALGPEGAQGIGIVNAIRKTRFCPVLVFTDGPRPEAVPDTAFVRVVDKIKTENLVGGLELLLATGIPAIARRLHDDLDREAGSYLWTFLEAQWDKLEKGGLTEAAVLERIMRRRAALLLARLSPGAEAPVEVASIEGAEFYVYPSVSGDEIRLGEILRDKKSGQFRVVLTPHCYLAIQPGSTRPRSGHVLSVKAHRAEQVIARQYGESNPWSGDQAKKMEKLRKRTQSPVEEMKGAVRGRFFYLPPFLEIPHLYCDFECVESMPLSELTAANDRVAALDAPFAEALQSSFTRFYSAVGVPNVNVERLTDLMGAPGDQRGGKHRSAAAPG